MIIAGDYIDTTIGVTFGISTMAAAGLGEELRIRWIYMIQVRVRNGNGSLFSRVGSWA
jgi:hypothetical protein